MSDKILVVVETTNGQIKATSFETLVFGQRIAEKTRKSVHAVLLGNRISPLSSELAQLKLDSVMVVEDDLLEEYTWEAFSAALEQLIRAERPQIVLLGHTYQSIDLAPRLAARFRRPLLTDAVGFNTDSEGLLFRRQMFRNKLLSEIRINSDFPWFVTVQAGAFAADALEAGVGRVTSFQIDLSDVSFERTVLERVELAQKKVDLSKAETVIGIGRGIKKEENMSLVQELAEVLEAEIGASRPVVDNGWLERDRQIGSSGQTVSPKLYIAAGISGAIQHVVGMKSSGVIVAINTDRNAPIFNVADYGIIGDLTEILPAIIQRIRELKAS